MPTTACARFWRKVADSGRTLQKVKKGKKKTTFPELRMKEDKHIDSRCRNKFLPTRRAKQVTTLISENALKRILNLLVGAVLNALDA